MTHKRIVLALIACTMLFVAGFEENCVSPAGNSITRGTAVAGTTGGSSTVGVTVTSTVPTSVETLQDVRANAPQRRIAAGRDRAIPFRRIQRPGDASVFSPRLFLNLAPAVSSLFAPASLSPNPMAPALDNSFAGLGNPSTFDIIPPDTMGVAGPNHLVSLLNSEFGVFDKVTGLDNNSVITLDSFWSIVWTLDPVVLSPPSTFDPRIIFDTHSGRYITVSVAGRTAHNSWLLLAISLTSDPTGAWVILKIDADLDADNVVRTNSADFPDLGVDNTNIYVTANMFDVVDTYRYSKVWVIPKDQPLLTGGSGSLTWTEFRDPTRDGRFVSTLRPAHTYGTAGAEYFVYEGATGGLAISKVDLSGPGGALQWTTLGSVAGVNTFPSAVFLPGLPQLGNSNTIDSSDTRLLNAVYRNGSLWTTHHVENTSGMVEVAWYRINPATLSIMSQGRIGDASRWYAYPSIAVNQNDDVAIGFSGSSPTEYVSGYYTMMKSGTGTMQPVSLMKSGVAPYYKTGLILGRSGTDNRWGDYSATCVDPADNVSFWTLQEYAETPSAGKSMWGTWWGRFRPATVNAPTDLRATAVSQTRIDLAWTDSSNETGYKVERRLIPGGDYSVIATPAANATSYIDNSGLVAGTTYSYRVQATDATGGSNSAEAQATTLAVQAPGGGGGCAIGTNRPSEDHLSPMGTVLILLSPLGVLALLRRSSVPPRGRPAAP